MAQSLWTQWLSKLPLYLFTGPSILVIETSNPKKRMWPIISFCLEEGASITIITCICVVNSWKVVTGSVEPVANNRCYSLDWVCENEEVFASKINGKRKIFNKTIIYGFHSSSHLECNSPDCTFQIKRWEKCGRFVLENLVSWCKSCYLNRDFISCKSSKSG